MLQVQRDVKKHMVIPPHSFKFSRCQSGVAQLTCCFEFQGVERLRKDYIIPEL